MYVHTHVPTSMTICTSGTYICTYVCCTVIDSLQFLKDVVEENVLVVVGSTDSELFASEVMFFH